MTRNINIPQHSIEEAKKLINLYIENKFTLLQYANLKGYCFVLMRSQQNAQHYFMPIRNPPKLNKELYPVPIGIPISSRKRNGKMEPDIKNYINNQLCYCSAKDHPNYRNLFFELKQNHNFDHYRNLMNYVAVFPQLFSPILLKDWQLKSKQSSSGNEAQQLAARMENPASLD